MTSLDTFLSDFPVESFDKGQSLLLANGTPKGVYIIQSGAIEAYVISASGDKRLIAVYTRNDDFPVGYADNLVNASPHFYGAYTKCRVRIVPRETYVAFLKSNPEALYQQHLRLTITLLATLSRIHGLEQSKAADKIAFTLLYMADRVGEKLRPYKSQLRLNITQQEIANFLGITRETTGNELKKLEVMKLMAHSRKSYTLHMEKLRKYIKDK